MTTLPLRLILFLFQAMPDQNQQPLALSSQLEAVLFFHAEPLSLKELTVILKEPIETVKVALKELETALYGRGISLIQINDVYSLGTAKEASSLIEEMTKEELSKDIGKAGLETLAIIMYKGAVTRKEIDFIRGVNSTFIIRNLLIRGLIEKVEDEGDKRQFRYRATIDLLSHLGLSKTEDLPEFTTMKTELEKLHEHTETKQELPVLPE